MTFTLSAKRINQWLSIINNLRCYRCYAVKPSEDFKPKKALCKKCDAELTRIRHKNNPEYKAKRKSYTSSPERKESQKQANLRFRAKPMTLATLPHTEQVAAILTASREAIKAAYATALQTGRPRMPNRCPCGAMTANRAKLRYHRCEIPA